ncbi:alpha/beta hydrolase fold-domain-containing protein [Mycena maculata]|uniref:Alpha/beta hydrolase fold-domain-containing protein n=1 Tax=Mycena maculata TaxID=230809 RepID=A0AAD7K5N5_9AGAR|nr:alpha/beta hydrolase fold-domain-containing protein [Mycena maculata]
MCTGMELGRFAIEPKLSTPSSRFGNVGQMSVPLNYSEPHGEKAAIAITRYPAAVPADSPLYHGPILFNPGSPGGSGVALIASAGSVLAQIIGPEFDIVGFDPRGVSHSTLHVSLFETDIERALWDDVVVRDMNTSADTVGRQWACAQVNGHLASERAGNYLPHINTENTARDMMRIVEAHGREKLQYWGFSYGSVLGAVFASIFPDNVGHLIIDGVVDTEDYFDTDYSLALWANNMVDADKAMQTFFDGCSAAGPDGCAFYAPTPDSIRTQPIPVRTPSNYGLVDLALLRRVILDVLYAPQGYFAPLAEVLAALTRSDGAPLFELPFLDPTFECSCEPTDHQADVLLDQEALMAIICNDGRAVPSGFEEAERHYKNMLLASDWGFGGLFASIRISCSGWPDIPKKHFQGPVGGNTSVPMLIIGNTAVLTSAKKTVKAFPGSVVLTQDCAGHSSLAAPSPCTWGYVRDYFLNGTLPETDTVCPVVGSPFPDARLKALEETVDQSVLEAFTAMQRSRAAKLLL